MTDKLPRILNVSVDQLVLVTRFDEFDLGLKWNAKTEIEFDPIYVLFDGKIVAKVTNERTIFWEHMASQENFTQTVKGFSTTRLRWSLSLVVFDARRTVDSPIALDDQN